jgi:hypothetical protein
LFRYHLDIARQLQADGNRKSAEKHFIAVIMTCSNEKFALCYVEIIFFY